MLLATSSNRTTGKNLILFILFEFNDFYFFTLEPVLKLVQRVPWFPVESGNSE